MSFSIAFADEPLKYPYDDPSIPAAIGILTLDNFQEHFLANLHEWTKEDYEAQWKYALQTLLSGSSNSALIVDYLSPESADYLEWWPMYLAGEEVVLHDQLLFYQQLPKPFHIEEAFASILERRSVNEDGNEISEWRIDLSEVKRFLASLA
jgi:hypothetical protein